MQFASRVSACRRELNSHNAAKARALATLRRPHPRRATQRLRAVGNRAVPLQQVTRGHRATGADEIAPVCRLERPHCVEASEFQLVHGAAGGIHAAIPGRCGRLEDVARTGRQRGAVGTRGRPARITTPRCTCRRGATCTALPNPSFNRTRYGRPPWPGWRYAVHFRQPGQGVPPPRAG